MRLFRLGFTRKLFLLAFLLQLASAVLLVTAVWHFVQTRIDATTQNLSTQIHNDFRNSHAVNGREGLSRAIANRLSEEPDDQLALLLVDREGRVLAGNLRNWPAVVSPDRKWHKLPLYRQNRDGPELMGLIGSQLDDGTLLLTGHVIEDERQLLIVVAEVLALSLVLAAALAVVGAWCTVSLVNSTIDIMVRTSEAVAAGHLDERVPQTGDDDPFERLAGGINAMLDRLDRLVLELRLVTDGMAHDLRMPLMRLAANLENASLIIRDDTALELIEKADTEVLHLLHIVTTALEIGRIESGVGRDRFERVALDELLGDVAEIFGPLAEERGFTLRLALDSAISLPGNRQLLFQAISNLIENALKYAPGGELVLALENAGEEALVSVEDRGPGIPEAERANALRRFGRLDPARKEVGAGLGFALVEAVARLHNGRLELADAHPGLRVTLALTLN